MDTAISRGDFLVTTGCIPKECDRLEELLQQVYLRLKAKRGALPYQPDFGSRLHTLTGEARTTEAVLTCIAEAMEGCENAEVRSVKLTDDGIVVNAATICGNGTITI